MRAHSAEIECLHDCDDRRAQWGTHPGAILLGQGNQASLEEPMLRYAFGPQSSRAPAICSVACL